jgi:cytochrome c oxidase subunit 2
MNSLLPDGLSTFSGRIDSLFMLILVITGIVFVLVEIALVVFVIRWRRREGRKAQFVHGNNRLEIGWTAATAVIVLALAFLSRGLWLDLKHPDHFPEPGLEVGVHASQFEWNVTYPGPDAAIGTADDFVRRNQLHVPAGVIVRVVLTAEDVIHSFFLPEMRVKQDAVPGMSIPTWFEATTPGTYSIGCAELCGLGHYRMRGTLTVHTAESFGEWQQTQLAIEAGADAAPAAVADVDAAPPDVTPVLAAQSAHAHH